MSRQSTVLRIIHTVAALSVIGLLTACGGGDDGAPPVPPTIQTTLLQPADVGLGYSATLSAAGTGPFTWTRTSGALPAGLNLATDGTVSGTPTSPGPSSFQVEVTGPGGKDGPTNVQLLVRDKVYPASVNSSGAQGNGDSGFSLPPSRIGGTPSFSRDGGYVAFESLASNLVPNDTNALRDIFVHDRQTGLTARVSVATGGLNHWEGPVRMPASLRMAGSWFSIHLRPISFPAIPMQAAKAGEDGTYLSTIETAAPPSGSH